MKAPEFDITAEDLKPYIPKASGDDLNQAVQVCKQYQLTPQKNQIVFQMRWNKAQSRNALTWVIKVDGFRLIAERSKRYTGQDGPYWCGPDSVWKDVWVEKTPPVAAKVGVRRKGFDEPLYAVTLFDSYKQMDDSGNLVPIWKKMPAEQLAKCAECAALRRAFPDELAGADIKDDLEGHDSVTEPPKTDPAPPPVPDNASDLKGLIVDISALVNQRGVTQMEFEFATGQKSIREIPDCETAHEVLRDLLKWVQGRTPVTSVPEKSEQGDLGIAPGGTYCK